MKTIRYCLITTLLLLPALSFAQEVLQRDSVKVYFRQGKSAFDPVFQDNVWRLAELSNKVKQLQLDSLARVERVEVIGSASPEGSDEVNRRLTQERARAILEYLRPHLRFDESNFEVAFNQLDWDFLEALVREDSRVPQRDEVLRLIGGRDLAGLKKMQSAWNYMLQNLFPEMRATVVAFEYMALESELKKAAGIVEPEVVVVPEEPKPEPVAVIPPLPDDDEAFSLDLSEDRPWSFYLKTNFLSWALLEANLGIEFEMGRHFSFSIPVYYTALDWFDIRTKFRVAGTQPELRYWFRDNFSGPFLAAHGTFGYYNVALSNQEYRIQDRDGKHPAYGGGLNFGWKFRLDPGRADRWGLELSLGAGYLHLDYDRFYNVENGRYASSAVRDYFGPDHASVALTYRFGK